MTGITQRQADCLNAINLLTTADGVTPSFEQLRVHLGIANKSGVHRLIEALEKRGYVYRQPYVARGLTVVRMPVKGKVETIMALIMATDTAAFLGERSQQVIRDCIARGLAQ